MAMDANRIQVTDKPTRASALPGALVALAAIIGANFAVSATAAMGGLHKPSGVAVRAIMPVKTAFPTAARALTLTAGALLVLLLLRTAPILLGRMVVVQRGSGRFCGSRLPSRLRRKLIISCRTGGLYGP